MSRNLEYTVIKTHNSYFMWKLGRGIGLDQDPETQPDWQSRKSYPQTKWIFVPYKLLLW